MEIYVLWVGAEDGSTWVYKAYKSKKDGIGALKSLVLADIEDLGDESTKSWNELLESKEVEKVGDDDVYVYGEQCYILSKTELV